MFRKEKIIGTTLRFRTKDVTWGYFYRKENEKSRGDPALRDDLTVPNQRCNLGIFFIVWKIKSRGERI